MTYDVINSNFVACRAVDLHTFKMSYRMGPLWLISIGSLMFVVV